MSVYDDVYAERYPWLADTVSRPDVIGLAEFAALAGVSAQTLSNWMRRPTVPGLPEPTQLACGPIWHRSYALLWIQRRHLERDQVNS
ncbi:MAG: hypothetical protein ACRCZD_12775 [Phycicoccus sp.]